MPNYDKMILTSVNSRIVSALITDSKIVDMEFCDTQDSILGNIYTGRVKNIVKNINSAFVEIENGRMCYLSFEESKNAVFCPDRKSELISNEDIIIVQVLKEDMKTKAPALTCDFCLTGKYAVLHHGSTVFGISSKIKDEKRRSELKEIVQKYKSGNEPLPYGIIIRTNAENEPDDVIIKEINNLQKKYYDILEIGKHSNHGKCIYRAVPSYIQHIRDARSDNLGEILTYEKNVYDDIEAYLKEYSPEELKKLRFYDSSDIPLNRVYSIDSTIEAALKKKVWLNSGGTLVIEPTEAMVVIDVNTGKSIRDNKNIQQHFTDINLEACREIAYQIRLRNLSGIIMIDFIDMKSREDRKKVMDTLGEYLKNDPIKATVVDMTSLNIVEVTRMKIRKPLYEQNIK